MFLCVISVTFCATGTSNAIMYGGHDYIVMDYNEASWDDATSHMLTSLGSNYHLVTITSAGEQTFIQSLIDSGSDEYWLGGYQQPLDQSDEDAQWWWVNNEGMFWNNGSTGMYANWDSGEPNDYYSTGSEQYLAMWANGWTWNDESALTNITGYIAESAPVPEPSTILLMGAGLIGLVGYNRKRFSKKKS